MTNNLKIVEAWFYGKTIQHREKDRENNDDDWQDCRTFPAFSSYREYRIKPLTPSSNPV